MEIDKEYIILESIYRKKFGNNKNIIPYEWYNVKNYDLKKKILNECIKNNILIINSNYYYKFRLNALNDSEVLDENYQEYR